MNCSLISAHELKELLLPTNAGFIDIAKNSSDVYLFLISKKISPETAPFDEVYEQIKEVIKMEKARKAYSELYNSLEKKSKIKLYHKNISWYRKDPAFHHILKT